MDELGQFVSAGLAIVFSAVLLSSPISQTSHPRHKRLVAARDEPSEILVRSAVSRALSASACGQAQ